MTIGIGLITIDVGDHSPVGGILSRCGFAVRIARSAKGYCDDAGLPDALCIVIDLPANSGLEALEMLRARGVRVPVILMADAVTSLPPARLAKACALDVLQRPVDTSELLGWIECVCAATMVLERRRAA